MAKRISMGRIDELPPGKVIEKRILAKRIAVFNDGGELFGIESDCKHMRASLAGGCIDEGTVQCPWHGWRYELKTGKCLTVSGMDLKRYQVETDNGEIFLIL